MTKIQSLAPARGCRDRCSQSLARQLLGLTMGGRERTKRVQATVYRTARLADAGQDVVNESIAAKVFATEVANQLVDLAVQPVGGEALALVPGHPLEHTLRRLRTLRLAEGETDTQRVHLARGHLDLGKGRL